jgi:glycosyltransferase involved in cell wall biosynthesis
VVYATTAGVGGLGLQAATAVVGLATAGPVVALGTGRAAGAMPGLDSPAIAWESSPPQRLSWFTRQVVRRLRPGRLVLAHDRHVGVWAAGRLADVRPGLVYTFTQVGLEALEWAKRHGVPTVLDNPNGHIRGFAEAYRTEWARWVGGTYRAHPTDEMIARVEREYELADRIRVSSGWARQSMVGRGVPADKVFLCPQPPDLIRFRPPTERRPASGPLRVVYVGSLDLRKGFVYLLRATRLVGPGRVRVELVGGTGDRGSKRLLARERIGLDVTVAPGDPVPAYHRAELFVLPSLEDGFGFVAAEAMACGLPVVLTDQCGAAEWVRPGDTGWVIPAGSAESLAAVFEQALANRERLAEMGRAARLAVEARDPGTALRLLAERVYSVPCAS